MIIGINAINLRAGGGRGYILELLATTCPLRHNFKKIVIWGNSSLLSCIPDKPWLDKISPEAADMGLIARVFWQIRHLKSELKKNNCDILFAPGGSDFSGFRPIIGMSQNMLPFDYKEIRRYGISLATVKFLILRLVQTFHLKNANGVIFLSAYAKSSILKIISVRGLTKIIPHGINSAFKFNLDKVRVSKNFLAKHEVKLLYISNIEYYKHQWNVIEAVALLRSQGFPLSLDLIGAPIRGYSRVKKAINRFDPEGVYVRFHGEMKQKFIISALREADIFIFASSCENLPITLLEAMASSVPIASSNMGPMPEVLGDAGVYFSPLDTVSIANAVRQLYSSHELRETVAKKAFSKSTGYTWNACANETFRFVSEVAKNYYYKS